MLNQEELDNKIRQLLQGHVVNPPASTWSQIDQKLPQKSGMRRLLPFLFLPVCIFVAGAAFYYFGQGYKNQSETANLQTRIENINTSPFPNNSELDKEKRQNQRLSLKNNASGNGVHNQIANQTKSVHTTAYPPNNNFLYPMNHSYIQNTVSKNHTTESLVNLENLSQTVENKENSLTYLNPILIPEKQLENNFIELNNNPLKTIKQQINTLSNIGSSRWQLGVELEPGWQFGSASALVLVTTVTEDSVRNSQGAYAMHSSSEKYAYKSSRNSQYSFGFSLGLRPAPHWVISSGIFYKNITQKYIADYSIPSPMVTSYTTPASNSLGEYDFYYNYLSIPLQLKYQFSTNGRLGFFVNGGGACNLLWFTSNSSGFVFSELKSATFPTLSKSTGSKSNSISYTTLPFSLDHGFTGFSTNLGTGVSWILSPKISLQAGISLNYMVSGISSDNKNNLFGVTVPVGVSIGL